MPTGNASSDQRLHGTEIADSVIDLIGNTPLVRLKRISEIHGIRCVLAMKWSHLWIGLFKCTLYAALLSLAGCREGLHAGRDAQAVGLATTTGVVKGLVWIIAAACATTVALQSLGF